ncbi:MAG: glyoxylate/hydroxypyruvate reductase A, partial [Gammaproteobacteria bacterium]|nr:glyoxylate/hydroxypyruvate reductase A [Gammaproteobacteria bacterium]
LAALDDGHVGAAALDVFNQEPLPGDHPDWSQPAVTISPHIASVVHPASSTRHIVENIRRHRAGQPLVHVANLARGY